MIRGFAGSGFEYGVLGTRFLARGFAIRCFEFVVSCFGVCAGSGFLVGGFAVRGFGVRGFGRFEVLGCSGFLVLY